MSAQPDRDYAMLAGRALAWAQARDYTGYNKHDGLNSPLLRHLSLGNKWLRIVAIQAVMRSPIHVRPWLGVAPVRNPKGIALFARAWLNLHRLTGDDAARSEAGRLLDWLIANPSSHHHPGLAWGYGYDWQDPGFFAPAGSPNRIVTYFVGRALVDGYETLGAERFLHAAEGTTEFILNAPKVLHEDATTKCLSYVPRDDITMAVMDVSCLCGALCAMVGRHRRRDDLLGEARRLMAWVVDKQLDDGAWHYTHPPGDSHINHDNYHSGEIVDSLLEYERYSDDADFHGAYRRGLAFYERHLFTDDWRPKWMSDREYPYDAHGYAQGIISFCTAGDLDKAARVARAAVEDIWDEADGRFYYQRRRRFTIRFTLMRWSQAWMAYAMSRLAADGAGGHAS